MAKEIIPQPPRRPRARAAEEYIRPVMSIEELDSAHAAASKRGVQVLPTAWKPGDRAMFIESDELVCGQLVHGTLRGRVRLRSFRFYRGRRAWYVDGTLPTATGGALAFEDDLRQLNGQSKVDARFEAFLCKVYEPAFGNIDVRSLASMDADKVELLNREVNPEWLRMEGYSVPIRKDL